MCSFYSLWLIQPEHTGQNRLALSQLFLCKLKKERCSWCRCIAISLHFRLWEELSDRYAYSRCVLAYSIFFFIFSIQFVNIYGYCVLLFEIINWTLLRMKYNVLVLVFVSYLFTTEIRSLWCCLFWLVIQHTPTKAFIVHVLDVD